MATWQDSIAQYAAKFGVPAKVINTVIAVESGGNPSASGDNGSSFGLLQLHQGGQLGSLSQADAFNPITNLNTGLPYLAGGYKQAGTFNDSLTWWETFAGASGHPGGNPGNSTTDTEAQALKTAYDTGIATSVDGSFVGGVNAGSGSATVANGSSASGSSSASTSLSSFVSNVGMELLLVLIGVTLVGVGIYFISN